MKTLRDSVKKTGRILKDRKSGNKENSPSICLKGSEEKIIIIPDKMNALCFAFVNRIKRRKIVREIISIKFNWDAQ